MKYTSITMTVLAVMTLGFSLQAGAYDRTVLTEIFTNWG